MKDDIRSALNVIETQFLFPDQIILESATGSEVIISGKKMLMFGSYNYLGLANNEIIKKNAIKVLNKYGVGTGGVRLLTGTMDIHLKLERKIANLTGQDDAITIASGYGTNIGIIPGIINLFGLTATIKSKPAVILGDKYNHASIVDGCRLSDAKLDTYNHLDMSDLEKKLKLYNDHRILIITDGIFSMDGDIAPLDKIVFLAKKYGAMTMVDDAHAFGVIGNNGSGTAGYFGLNGLVDINMGTFSKGIGVSGGFVSASNDIIKLLRASCKSFMFSDSLSPMVVGAVDAALDYIEMNPDIIKSTEEKSKYFRDGINKLGYSTLNSTTHIVPLITGNTRDTMEFTKKLMDNNICAPAVRWPAVPRDKGRIRFAICANHEYSQIDTVLSVLSKLRSGTKHAN